MLTYKETDYPVAYKTSGVEAGEFIYYTEDYKEPPPKKIRKLLEMYDLPQPEYGNEIECDHPYEDITPLFRPKERITMFIAGCQNCGKSYYISNFLRTYRMIHPERPVFLVTGLSEKDKHFEALTCGK